MKNIVAGGNFWDGARQGVITAGLNHAMHEIFPQDPGKPKGKKELQQHRKEAVTLDEWVERYGGFSQAEIALESGKDKFGLPLGPNKNYRYVINPYYNNVMDMRHVTVVGYGMGEMAGLGAEMVQKVAGWFGLDPTKSAFNPQDRYSNNIGASFFNYDFKHHGLNMSFNFGQRFNQFFKTIYK